MSNFNFNQFFFESILPWFQSSGLKIIFIIIIVFVVRKLAGNLIERIIKKFIASKDSTKHSFVPEVEKKRADTISTILKGTINVVILIIASLVVLEEVGFEVGPFLAAAGIAGLALGFGGQYLIRDIITGLFFILENQYRVGDVVCLSGTCGLVENITLRMTTLRDVDGTVHHIPHGEIKKVSNLSKDFSRVNINIGIAYNSNMEKVKEIINRIGKELAEDSEWKDKIIKAPEFVRIDKFGDSAIEIKILGETKPIEQWGVAGELRMRLKIAFDKEGIEIPFPQRVVHQGK